MSISPEDGEPILRAEGIVKSFDGNHVLGGLSVELYRGELVSILGQSGCGKTTLFNILSGLDSPDSGRVTLEGEDVTGRPGKISYMLQKDLLLPYKTILDNACLPLVIRGEKKKDAREKARGYFGEFGLGGCEDQYPAQLSGGMRQRAALLRTYMASGKVALLDEPFSALDTLTKSAMHGWYLGVMADIELSTFFITHDIDEAILLSDRIYVIGGKPAVINSEIKIDRPRGDRKDFNLTEEFLAYKKRIVACL